MVNFVREAINGNKDAFIKLMQSVENKMYIVAKCKLDNIEDIKDVIQETIYECYRNIHSLRNEEKFESWMLSILINNCNKFYKNENNRYHVSYDENEINDIGNNDLFSKIDRKVDFFNLVNLLDSDEKQIFILFYVYDYTTAKIAEILNLNENTIKSKLKRSREKVKHYIERSDKYGL